ncbi:hypothetical protein [Marinobacter sp.]|uniref:hypothetical protein n=1 Tax=Marinobacter sp. TaxID=50741 RepID=UPI00356300AE
MTLQLLQTRPMSLTALCIQSFPFALLRCPVFGDMQWGTKTKKNPGKNKNNADRQRFQGGFVKTDPPFDFLGPVTVIHGKRVQIPLKPLNSRFLLIATTDFNA